MNSKPVIGIDLDGVIRHNNKSLGTGDIPKESRTKATLLALHKSGRLPYCYYVTDIEQVEFILGTIAALRVLYRLGWDCYVITNQEAIGVGVMTEEHWRIIRDDMSERIRQRGGRIKDWFHCPHFPDAGCNCRKPKLGLFYQLRDMYGVDLRTMYMIGDNPSDVEAGHAAGCKCNIHVRLASADKEFQESKYADAVVSDLGEAVRLIISKEAGG